jgi:hypothetical protein
MGFISTDCMTAPCRQMLFAMRTVFVAQGIVCSAFEVLPSVAFHLIVLPISELVRTRRRSWRRVRATAPTIV